MFLLSAILRFLLTWYTCEIPIGHSDWHLRTKNFITKQIQSSLFIHEITLITLVTNRLQENANLAL